LPVAGAAFRFCNAAGIGRIYFIVAQAFRRQAGFKFSLGHPWEFFGICKAMLETGIRPDFTSWWMAAKAAPVPRR
jgi:hypothetical protein